MGGAFGLVALDYKVDSDCCCACTSTSIAFRPLPVIIFHPDGVYPIFKRCPDPFVYAVLDPWETRSQLILYNFNSSRSAVLQYQCSREPVWRC